MLRKIIMQDLERQNKILEYLKEHHSATVEFLAKTFYASPSTIRRDLTFLEKTGMVHRTHGGVIYNDRIKELSILVRRDKNEEIKNRLTEEAAKFIPDFNSIFIDNSSTCFPLIKHLKLNKKLVVTNSLLIVREVDALFDAKVIFLGGEYDIDNMSVSGPLTNENLANFHFDLMVQSCAYANKDGVFENVYHTAAIKRIARHNASHAILIFDRTKFEKSAACKTGDLSDFDLIVSDMNEEEKNNLLKDNANLNIHTIN